MLILVFSLHYSVDPLNAFLNIAMLFGTAMSGFSLPSIYSET